MKAATLKALKGSILKWKKIVAGTGRDHGTANCPLCDLFFQNSDGPICEGCPVAKATHRTDCMDTPYMHWSSLFNYLRPWKATSKAKKNAAQFELDFLKSLLPKKKKK